MQSLRQLGGGVIIAIVSVILVVGGIMLALAESSSPAEPAEIQPTPTQFPPTFPLSFFTSTAPAAVSPSETATASLPPPPTNTLLPPTSCTPPSGWIRVIASAGDTIYSLAQRYKTTPENLSAANCLTSAELPAGFALYVPPVPTVTVIPCGPPAGWVKTHVVQPGDNLYRIALSYNITYPQLQRANCMGSSTTIYAGQRLWVPNVPTLTPIPGVTVIPNFPTSTDTPVPLPTTAVPTLTDVPTATSTFIATATSTQIPTTVPPPTYTPTASITPFPTSTP